MGKVKMLLDGGNCCSDLIWTFRVELSREKSGVKLSCPHHHHHAVNPWPFYISFLLVYTHTTVDLGRFMCVVALAHHIISLLVIFFSPFSFSWEKPQQTNNVLLNPRGLWPSWSVFFFFSGQTVKGGGEKPQKQYSATAKCRQ